MLMENFYANKFDNLDDMDEFLDRWISVFW